MVANKAPIRPLTLQFQHAQMEEAFVAARKSNLARRTLWMVRLHLFASSSVLVLFILAYARDAFPSDVAFCSNVIQASCHVLMSLSSCLLGVMMSSRCSLNRMSPFEVEALVMVDVTLTMLISVFTSPYRMAKLQGYSLTDAFGEDAYNSDSTILLTIDAFVTASHLALPIRWHMMAPLELAAVLSYIIVLAAVGSEEPPVQIVMNIILIVSLVGASAFGKRALEMDQRKAFLSMINEKALRCEAEFRLSRVTCTPEKDLPCDGMSAENSEYATVRSGVVFDPLHEMNVGSTEQLELVARLGDAEHWRIDASEVGLLPEDALGAGGFGTIQRAIFCGMLVAVKCPRLDMGAMKVSDLCNELRVLRHLRHPNIVAAHGAVVLPEQRKIFLVLELIDGMCLTDFVLKGDKDARPSELARYQVMLGVGRALLYMHTRIPQIVHGDLKGSNIMVEAHKGYVHPKVLDFGLSRVLTSCSRALGGTLRWVAPEVIEKGPVRCSADVYSFGHVLAFTATGIMPMKNMRVSSIIRALQKRKPPPPAWPEGCPFSVTTCKPLVSSCLNVDPKKRPKIREIYTTLLALPDELQLRSLSSSDDQHSSLESVILVAEQSDKVVAIDLLENSMQLTPSGSKLPSLPENEPLKQDILKKEDTSQHSSPARRMRRVPHQELLETSQSALESTLLTTFQRWNVAVPLDVCCERHMWFRACQETCARALASDCTPSAGMCQLSPGSQCLNCGVLGVAETCDVCGCDQEESFEASRGRHAL